jgi:hypothetical protein
MDRIAATWRWLMVLSIIIAFAVLVSSLLWRLETPHVDATSLRQTPLDNFKLPFPGVDETWDVTNGYGQFTHAYGDELYALDIAKKGSNYAAGKAVVAPVGLTIISSPGGFSCSKAGDQGVGIVAQMDGRPSNHFLKICHFQVAPYKKHYNQGEPFVIDAEGKTFAVVYSQGNNSHIHMNLFSADYPDWDNNRQPIPFDNEHGYPLEGMDLKPGETYQCIKDKDGKKISGLCDLRSTQPPIGDINNDNRLDILDYNLLLDCYSDLLEAKNCNEEEKQSADLNDDGFVNQVDYNIMVRAFANLAEE